MKNVIKPLAKSALAPLGLTAAMLQLMQEFKTKYLVLEQQL